MMMYIFNCFDIFINSDFIPPKNFLAYSIELTIWELEDEIAVIFEVVFESYGR